VGLEVSIDNRKDFEVVTEMIQPAVLADIVDKGMVPGKFGTKHKCYLVWIVSEEDTEGRNKRVFESFTVSLHEKARLRKRVKELRGKDVEAGEKLDLDSLIGTTRVLVMSQEDSTEKDGKPFIQVIATQPIKKGMVAPSIPADFIRKKDKPQQ
jgi:hypothetical protein